MILKLDLPATGQSEGIAELYGRLQQTDKPPNEMLMVTADIKEKSHKIIRKNVFHLEKE